MAETGDFDRYQRRDRRDYDRSDRRGHDDRGSRGGNYYDPRSLRHDEDRRRGGRGGRGRHNDYRRGPPQSQRRVDDRFYLFRTAAKNQDWKGDSIEYSEDERRRTDGTDRRRPSQRDEDVFQNSLRFLWSASPEPPVQKNAKEMKREKQSDGGGTSSESEDDSSSSDSSSSDSSSEESRRRRRRRHRKRESNSKRKRKDGSDRKRKSRNRRYSSSSSSSSESSSSSDDAEERAPKRSRKPSADIDQDAEVSQNHKNENEDVGLGLPGAPAQDSDDDSVGPQPAPGDEVSAAADMGVAGGGKANYYGKALLPGEGSAMAQYVQNNMRVPRRGEIGYEADQIDRFEKSGYVMSGSRHARMNAVRIRKENQVYTAEEQRALALITLEEKAEKEKALVQDFRAILEQKLQSKDETQEG